mmetsp:Transcript_63538/g.170010  ORF Transcript_63538/g.170010 Transcript_63538/m.170010 type:complete len:260 (+) Transcript_63538:459-1238(+)
MGHVCGAHGLDQHAHRRRCHVRLLLHLGHQALQPQEPPGPLPPLLPVHVAHHAHQVAAARRLAQLRALAAAGLAQAGLAARTRCPLVQPCAQLGGQLPAVGLLLRAQLLGPLARHGLGRRAAGLHGPRHLLEQRQLAHVAEEVVEGAATEHEPEQHPNVHLAHGLGLLDAILAPLVVDLSLVAVRQHLIGLGDGFKSLLRLGVVRILVRMPLASHLVVGFLDLRFGGFLGDSKDGVIVLIPRCQSRGAARSFGIALIVR